MHKIKEEKYKLIEKSLREEKETLMEIIKDEINFLKKGEVTDIKCSMTVLQDAIFAVDKAFEDILGDINEANVESKRRKAELFKESLIYIIYEK